MPTPDPIDAALRSALRSGEKPSTPSCDAEIAVAYVERRLQQPERERFETHMAECSGCRALAAAMVQELPLETPPPVPARRWFQLRWAVPALAGVVLVGSVVLYQRDRILERRATPSVSQVSVPAAPVPAPTPEAENKPAEKPPVPNAPVDARRVKGRELDELRARSDSPRQESVQVAAAPPPPPPAAAPAPSRDAERAVVVGAIEPLKEESKQKAVAQSAMPQLEGQAPAQNFRQTQELQDKAVVSARTSAAGGEQAYSAVKMAKLVYPLPDGAPVNATIEHDGKTWAVSTGGRIFQSTDGGRTWTKVTSPTTADLVRIRWDAQASVFIIGDLQGNEYRVKP